MVLFAAEPEVVLVDRAHLLKKRSGKVARVREQSWRKTVNQTCLSTTSSSNTHSIFDKSGTSSLIESRQTPGAIPCATGFWSTFCAPLEGEANHAITNNNLLDSSCGYSSPRHYPNREAKKENLLLAGLEFQPAFPKKNALASFSHYSTQQRKNTKVRFTEKDQYFEPLTPLTEEEKRSYFWNEDDCRIMKEERRSALLQFKDLYLCNKAMLWDDSDSESIRGLEDHTSELLGNKHSYYIRRDHLCVVMGEFHTQRWHGRFDPQRLCKISEKSSLLRRQAAVERALADRQALIK